MPEIVIHDLLDFPQWLPVITGWFEEEWRTLSGAEVGRDIEAHFAWLRRGGLPVAFVAVADGEAVGTVTLREQAPALPALPAISALYVRPQFRRQGVATKLLSAAEARAREAGLTRLYMFTHAPHAFYGAYGWQRYDEVRHATPPLTVLEKTLSAQRFYQPPPLARRG